LRWEGCGRAGGPPTVLRGARWGGFGWWGARSVGSKVRAPWRDRGWLVHHAYSCSCFSICLTCASYTAPAGSMSSGGGPRRMAWAPHLHCFLLLHPFFLRIFLSVAWVRVVMGAGPTYGPTGLDTGLKGFMLWRGRLHLSLLTAGPSQNLALLLCPYMMPGAVGCESCIDISLLCYCTLLDHLHAADCQHLSLKSTVSRTCHPIAWQLSCQVVVVVMVCPGVIAEVSRMECVSLGPLAVAVCIWDVPAALQEPGTSVRADMQERLLLESAAHARRCQLGALNRICALHRRWSCHQQLLCRHTLHSLV
jgi:hypothetical protein